MPEPGVEPTVASLVDCGSPYGLHSTVMLRYRHM